MFQKSCTLHIILTSRVAPNNERKSVLTTIITYDTIVVYRCTYRCIHRLPPRLCPQWFRQNLKEEDIMSLTRRQFLKNSAFGIGAVVGGSLLGACGAPQAAPPEAGGQPAPSALPAQGQETIQLRYSHWGSEDEKASTKATLDAFMKANPNIAVEQMYIPESGDPYLQKMTTM